MKKALLALIGAALIVAGYIVGVGGTAFVIAAGIKIALNLF